MIRYVQCLAAGPEVPGHGNDSRGQDHAHQRGNPTDDSTVKLHEPAPEARARLCAVLKDLKAGIVAAALLESCVHEPLRGLLRIGAHPQNIGDFTIPQFYPYDISAQHDPIALAAG